MSDIDKQIEEFHRAARRRKAVIYGIAGVLMLAVGAVFLIITFSGEGGDARFSGRFPVKVLVGGVAFLVGGLSSLYNAYRIGSGQVNDVDFDPGR